MKLIMLKGLPGSGKSTYAIQYCKDHPDTVRVNKDSIRRMMGKWSKQKEKLVLFVRDHLIIEALKANYNVIVDDTNFDPKHEAVFRTLAEGTMSEFEEIKFDTPLKECIDNDLKREHSVGEKVIRRMYNQYLAPKVYKPFYDPSLQKVIICDLDGTIALHTGRSPYDTAKCDTDVVNLVVSDLLLRYNERLIFVSGRDEEFRPQTVEWLKKNIGYEYSYLLFMRPKGDKREDSIVKEEIYNNEIKGKYNVELVLDDRNRVVEMWRRNGLTCFQVAEGDF